MDDIDSYGENVAAISANMHQNQEIYQEIYDTISDDVGGFVGIWSICAESAKVFTEEELPYTAGEDFYWIEAIEEYAHQIMGCLQNGEVPEIAHMHRLAA